MSRRHILVVEDDQHIRDGLIDTLESEGYAVEAAADGRAALDAWRREHFDLIVLDIMIPEINGYEVCRSIRQKDTTTPIIMLTAKGEEIDKVVGLELGADDYVSKPFGVRELLARIAAVLRRAPSLGRKQGEAHLPDTFPFGSVLVDRKTYVCRRGRVEAPLTARELRLLEVFYLHPGEVLSRDDLLNQVWGVDYFGTTRTLDQHIAQLRKKVEADPDAPAVITTVHGVGYRYTGPSTPTNGKTPKPAARRPRGAR